MKIRADINRHNEGLLGELETPLRAGAMCKTGELDHLAAIVKQQFPFVLNRIAWTKVPGHLFLPAAPRLADESRHPDRYYARRAPELRAFIEATASQHGIARETPVAFMGDSVSFVLRMTLTTLTEYAPILFSYPQHVYVIPERSEWCFSYTFEDDLFFGFAPGSGKRSPRAAKLR